MHQVNSILTALNISFVRTKTDHLTGLNCPSRAAVFMSKMTFKNRDIWHSGIEVNASISCLSYKPAQKCHWYTLQP